MLSDVHCSHSHNPHTPSEFKPFISILPQLTQIIGTCSVALHTHLLGSFIFVNVISETELVPLPVYLQALIRVKWVILWSLSPRGEEKHLLFSHLLVEITLTLLLGNAGCCWFWCP